MTLIEHRNGPLCPHSLPPVNAAHTLSVSLQNVAYGAMRKDPEGELTPEGEDVSMALGDDRMRLYVESGGGIYLGGHVSVRAYFFRCQVCGFVLPATEATL